MWLELEPDSFSGRHFEVSLQAEHRCAGRSVWEKVYYILTTCFNGCAHPAVTSADLSSVQAKRVRSCAGGHKVTQLLTLTWSCGQSVGWGHNTDEPGYVFGRTLNLLRLWGICSLAAKNTNMQIKLIWLWHCLNYQLLICRCNFLIIRSFRCRFPAFFSFFFPAGYSNLFQLFRINILKYYFMNNYWSLILLTSWTSFICLFVYLIDLH